jgi:hypothetical protein
MGGGRGTIEKKLCAPKTFPLHPNFMVGKLVQSLATRVLFSQLKVT